MHRRPARTVTASYEEVPLSPPPEVSAASYECDLCGERCEGLPAGKVLMLWWRGTEMRVEEPPLCEECAARITIGAAIKWALEDEEEG